MQIKAFYCKMNIAGFKTLKLLATSVSIDEVTNSHFFYNQLEKINNKIHLN